MPQESQQESLAYFLSQEGYKYKRRVRVRKYTTLNEPILIEQANPLNFPLKKPNPLINLINSGKYTSNPENLISRLVKEGADPNELVVGNNNKEIPLLHFMLQKKAPDNAIKALVTHGATVGPTTLTYMTTTTNELQDFLDAKYAIYYCDSI